MDDEEDHITEAMRECRLAIEGTNGGTDIIYWSPQNPPCHEYPGPPCFTYPLYAAIMPDRNAQNDQAGPIVWALCAIEMDGMSRASGVTHGTELV